MRPPAGALQQGRQNRYDAPVIDENAFGLLLGYYGIEDDEYGADSSAAFLERFQSFEREAVSALDEAGLPADRHTLCLGHAVYAEFHDAGDTPKLISQLRAMAMRLAHLGFSVVAVLAYGGRWADPDRPPLRVEAATLRLSGPSEPLRRCLGVLTHASSDEGEDDWGPGFYLDAEAAEAIGARPKNQPSVLRAAGGEFYRLSLPSPGGAT